MRESITSAEAPVVRIRVKHDFTVKDGWRLSETTVEFTSTMDSAEAGKALFPAIESLLQGAYQRGKSEADRRNSEEGR